MKKILLTAIIVFFTLGIHAQSKKYTSAINEIRSMYKMSSVTLTQETLQLFSFFSSALKEDAQELISGIKTLKINKNTKAAPDAFFNEAIKKFEDKGFYKVDISKYTSKNSAALFVERRLFSLKEAHFITRDNKGMVISAFGKFKYRDIKKVLKRVEGNGHNLF